YLRNDLRKVLQRAVDPRNVESRVSKRLVVRRLGPKRNRRSPWHGAISSFIRSVQFVGWQKAAIADAGRLLRGLIDSNDRMHEVRLVFLRLRVCTDCTVEFTVECKACRSPRWINVRQSSHFPWSLHDAVPHVDAGVPRQQLVDRGKRLHQGGEIRDIEAGE